MSEAFTRGTLQLTQSEARKMSKTKVYSGLGPMYRVAQPPSRMQKGKKGEWNRVSTEMNERKAREGIYKIAPIRWDSEKQLRVVLFLFIFVQWRLWFCCSWVSRCMCMWVMDAWLGVGKSIVWGCFATGCADRLEYMYWSSSQWSPSSCHCCCWVEGKQKSFTEGKRKRQTKQLTANYFL